MNSQSHHFWLARVWLGCIRSNMGWKSGFLEGVPPDGDLAILDKFAQQKEIQFGRP